MIAHHDSYDTIRLITPSFLKQYEGMENSANYHADKAGISAMNKETDISRRTNEILDKE